MSHTDALYQSEEIDPGGLYRVSPKKCSIAFSTFLK